MAVMGAEYKYYDLHSHILPEMDDGSRSTEESLRMLRLSAEQGAVGVAATPHYYPRETVRQFLDRRQRSAEALREAMSQTNDELPIICLGAEVAYHSGLIYDEQLELLCMGNSCYLLLELPFSKWAPSVLRDVQAMRSARGITPIIAHVERYWDIQDAKTMDSLLDMDVLIQMNAETYLERHSRRLAKRLLKEGAIQVMGSDCHNMGRRPPNLGPAFQQMWLGQLSERRKEILEQNRRIFLAAQSQRSAG